MAKDNKIFMPSSQGGLVRYFDEEDTKFKLKPGLVLAIILVAVVVLIILNTI